MSRQYPPHPDRIRYAAAGLPRHHRLIIFEAVVFLERLPLLEQVIMATLKQIQDQNAALVVAVQAEDTVIGAAVTLIAGLNSKVIALQQQLQTAIAAGSDEAIQAVADNLAQVTQDVQAKTQLLATALAQNTPADTLAGGGGADTTTGGSGTDTLGGGTGTDTTAGAAGTDTTTGAAGMDTLPGGGAVDAPSGTSGANVDLPPPGSDAAKV